MEERLSLNHFCSFHYYRIFSKEHSFLRTCNSPGGESLKSFPSTLIHYTFQVMDLKQKTHSAINVFMNQKRTLATQVSLSVENLKINQVFFLPYLLQELVFLRSFSFLCMLYNLLGTPVVTWQVLKNFRTH